MKILLIDDHALIREALGGVLKQLGADFELLEASDCRQAMQAIAIHADIQLILLDLNLPDRDGFSVLSELRQNHAAMSVVVLSAMNDRNNVLRALDLGALGFIPKSSSREVILNALRLIISGGVYIPPEALAPSAPVENYSAPKLTVSLADLGLTKRQLEVLALILQAKSNKMIARKLAVAEPTVKHHVTSILKALKVANRTEAILAVGALASELPRVT